MKDTTSSAPSTVSAISQHTYMSCPFRVLTTTAESTGELWVSVRFNHPDGEERQYATIAMERGAD